MMTPRSPHPAGIRPAPSGPSNFIRDIILEDLKTSKFGGRVHTRFPPEPNGYLHIGHAKSICLNFGLAAEFGGKTNLRFDDTNPEEGRAEYVDSIMENVRWLGFDWEDRCFYASDYFDQLYEWAVQLIQRRQGLRLRFDRRGGAPVPRHAHRAGQGKPLPQPLRRGEPRSVRAHAAGEFPDGSRTLRAKIDMASPNLNMRDPVMYRILHAEHHRTGDKWCIYPMYDFAHGQSRFDRAHHALDLHAGIRGPPPALRLVRRAVGHLPSAADRVRPAQPDLHAAEQAQAAGAGARADTCAAGTIRACRRFPASAAAATRRRRSAISAPPSAFPRPTASIELGLLEHYVREDLNKRAARVMAVLRPLRVVIDNYPEGQVEEMEAVNNPEDPAAGTRKVPFSRVLYIEQDDFREDPPKQYYRLSPGREVRLRYGYFITCTERGEERARRGGRDPLHLRSGHARRQYAPDGRKVKSTIHWVSAAHAVDAEVRLYDNLFTKENPNETAEGEDFTVNLNPNSLEDADRLQAGAVAGGCRRTRAAISSSAWVISASIRTPRPASRSSTARWRCGTRGPRSRNGRRASKIHRRGAETRRATGEMGVVGTWGNLQHGAPGGAAVAPLRWPSSSLRLCASAVRS